MTLDQLTQFYETARRGHLGNAAASLRLSPSAISYSIASLESELGVKLFEKRGKRIFLTAAGERLMEKIPQLQRSLDELKSHVSTGQSSLRGHYSIAATHMLAHQVIPSGLKKFIELHPLISLEILTSSSSEIIAAISDARINLGICFNPQDRPEVERRMLCSGQLKIFVRKNHPILRKRGSIELLNDYGAVLPKAQAGIDICESHPVFDRHGIRPRPHFAINSYDVGIKIVQNSDNWGFFPDAIAHHSNPRLEAMPLPKTWDAAYSISAVWNRQRPLDPGLTIMVEELARAFPDWRQFNGNEKSR
jgi:DNA-binding transcriptional LysR family regulator